MAAENQKSVAMKVAEKVEKQAAIKRVVNKKFSKTQPVVRPFILDKGGFQYYIHGAWDAVVGPATAVWNVLFIIPVIVLGILEAISQGALAGMEKMVSSYARRLGR